MSNHDKIAKLKEYIKNIVIKELNKNSCNIDLYDPWANSNEINEIYNKYPNTNLINDTYDGVIITVAHEIFKNMGIKKIKNLCKKKCVIYDLKYLFSKQEVDIRL